MSLRNVAYAAALTALASAAFAQGKMAPKPAAKPAVPKATMSCKMCKMNVCDKCSKMMGGKDKMGHKMTKGASGECAMCKTKMKGGKM